MSVIEAPTIYNYLATTGEYLFTSEADRDPLDEDNFLHPANSTQIVPPQVNANEIAIFNEGIWTVVPDFRGTVLEDPYNEGQSKTITEINVRPEDVVFVPPTPLTVDELRRRAYPAVIDQLDAIMKWLASDTAPAIPQYLQDIVDACMQVKIDYPKDGE